MSRYQKHYLIYAQAVCTYGFAFEEGHSVNDVFYLFSKLFFDGSPGITHIMHLLGAHQLHRSVTLRKTNGYNRLREILASLHRHLGLLTSF